MADALLVLEDGSAFPGRSFGSSGETFGEIVFNTAMSGYQEVVTDPSYSGQIVVMTFPHQGNYGTNEDDPESARIHAAGLVVRESARRASSWRAEQRLGDELRGAGVVGIEDVDTRAATLHIRERGAMRAAISTEDLDPQSLAGRVREHPDMLGADLARTVSTNEPYDARDIVGPPAPRHGRAPLRVAAYDWGIKRNILRLLARSGCRTTVYPAETPAEEVLAGGFDGVFLSNGPGDPSATRYAVDITRALLGRVPLFGICLGHQIVALAAGGKTYKLKFGHRGANQPVLNLDTGRVEVTSHNHGFAVDPRAWSPVVSGAGVPVRPGSGGPRGALVPQPLPLAQPSGTPRPAPDHGWPGEGPERGRGVWHGRARDPSRAAPPRVVTEFGLAALTHWNLNDGTLEGLRFESIPAFTVQYHPEAAPGPHDSGYLFARFIELMERS